MRNRIVRLDLNDPDELQGALFAHFLFALARFIPAYVQTFLVAKIPPHSYPISSLIQLGPI